MILAKFFSGAPLWVWGVLAYLLVRGWFATKDRTVYIPRLFLIPTILVAFKYKLFLTGSFVEIGFYLGALLVGLGIGYFVAMRESVVCHMGSLTVDLKGSYQTLILLLLLFVTRYFFGYLKAVHSDIAVEYLIVQTCLNALFSGFFFGKGLNYFSRRT